MLAIILQDGSNSCEQNPIGKTVFDLFSSNIVMFYWGIVQPS